MRTTYTTTTGDLLTVERDGADDWTFSVYVGDTLAGLVFKETDVASTGPVVWWKRSDNGERYTALWRAAAALAGLTITGEADDDDAPGVAVAARDALYVTRADAGMRFVAESTPAGRTFYDLDDDGAARAWKRDGDTVYVPRDVVDAWARIARR